MLGISQATGMNGSALAFRFTVWVCLLSIVDEVSDDLLPVLWRVNSLGDLTGDESYKRARNAVFNAGTQPFTASRPGFTTPVTDQVDIMKLVDIDLCVDLHYGKFVPGYPSG
ncbi:hypothetical protein CKAH01_18697 [Colletotrichum kahawae]|uniref:Uncharacterized protein n=1 Tax=Colletotrichum kahawae TaxID=34407 RepID=A0AAE0D137_COLKA|nr:hypothetical protein CKAH01_18697 [Colletotrichum kahawae]